MSDRKTFQKCWRYIAWKDFGYFEINFSNERTVIFNFLVEMIKTSSTLRKYLPSTSIKILSQFMKIDVRFVLKINHRLSVLFTMAKLFLIQIFYN
ncbi:hypothetical protein B0A69_02140 [Chryseobacterium shigense]|nr:hypothetical protein B0A69_02140 [Chryseobacterium shigense]